LEIVVGTVPVNWFRETDKSVHSKSNSGTGGMVPERAFESKVKTATVVNENSAGGIVPSRLWESKSKPSVESEVSLMQFSNSHSNRCIFEHVPSE